MRIAQVVLPDASQYERKSQRCDLAALSEKHTIVGDPREADVAHVYAGETLPRAMFVGFPVPYVASAALSRSRWSWRKPREPKLLAAPPEVPEAVEEAYFGIRASGGGTRIGTYARPSVRNMVEQTLSRITRFRTDVEWLLFERVPTPEDLAGVDVWVDPAVGENDRDGFVAEGLVIGLPVVASRTAINAWRLEQGRTGFLVPPRDPNELTHAILAALFKPEVAGAKQNAARQTMSKFRAKQRQRVLAHMYESLLK
jgi:Glycosyl transferases group 1